MDVLVGKTCAPPSAWGWPRSPSPGGVATNGPLREALRQRAPVPLRVPALRHCTDNAAMIASAGYFRLTAGDVSGWDLDVAPNLRLASPRAVRSLIRRTPGRSDFATSDFPTSMTGQPGTHPVRLQAPMAISRSFPSASMKKWVGSPVMR